MALLAARIAVNTNAAPLRRSRLNLAAPLERIAAVCPRIPAEGATRIIEAILAGEIERLRIRNQAVQRMAEAEKTGNEDEMGRELDELNRQWQEYESVWPGRLRGVIRSVLGDENFARYDAADSSRSRGAAGTDPKR